MNLTRIAELLAVALPVAMGFLLLLHVWRRRMVAAALGDPMLIRRLMGTDLSRIPWFMVICVAAAGAALGGALHLAASSHEPPYEAPAGGPVVLVLDASNSMTAADLSPNRLEVLRETARRLLDASPDSEFGLVIFAGRAYTLTPPTRDRAALEVYLAALDPEMVTQTGSSVAAAVRQGIGLLIADPDTPLGGTLVLISDGDDPDDPLALEEALDLASRAGVVIHTIGAATLDGAPVPLPVDLGSGATTGFLTTRDGTPVISRLGEPLMRHIAHRTGGEYVQAGDSGRLDVVARRLQAAADPATARAPSGYAWLALVALLLLVVQAGHAAARERER